MPTLLNALQILGANTQALQRRKDALEQQVLELDRQLQSLQLEMWSKSPISEDDFQDMLAVLGSEEEGMEAVRALDL